MNIILFDEGVRHFDCADERFRHIRSVLHLDQGDEFSAGELNKSKGKAVIKKLSDEGLDFDYMMTSPAKKLAPLTVILASVRPICMKRILRELVSMGVGQMIVTGSELGEKSYLKSALYTTDEYLEIMKSGAMQSGSCEMSEIRFIPDLADAFDALDGNAVRTVFDLCEDACTLSDAVQVAKPLVIAIGGERGWTDRERELFRSAGFRTVSLGSRILRSETAAVAGSALALSALGWLGRF